MKAESTMSRQAAEVFDLAAELIASGEAVRDHELYTAMKRIYGPVAMHNFALWMYALVRDEAIRSVPGEESNEDRCIRFRRTAAELAAL